MEAFRAHGGTRPHLGPSSALRPPADAAPTELDAVSIRVFYRHVAPDGAAFSELFASFAFSRPIFQFPLQIPKLFRHDAVRADGEGDDDVVVNRGQQAFGLRASGPARCPQRAAPRRTSPDEKQSQKRPLRISDFEFRISRCAGGRFDFQRRLTSA